MANDRIPKTNEDVDTGSISDGYHTFDELYDYRMLYHAHAANEWHKHGTYTVVKSERHSDGELCFRGGWFIVVAYLPLGQVSNHYKMEHWDLFDVPSVYKPAPHDGHTPRDAADRLWAALTEPQNNVIDQIKKESNNGE